MDTLDSLKEELHRLKNERAAFQTQSKLLETFVGMARTAEKNKMLTTILRQTLDISVFLTGADKGSIFLLDSNGLVTNSILTRDDVTSEQRSQLIGSVLDKGLVGWVSRHRKVGLIVDTGKDDRWLNLPNQPYTAGSALAVPIIRGDDLLGLLTLLHTQPGHFTDKSAELMQLTAVQIAIALENARLYAKLEEYSAALDDELEKGKKIQKDFFPREVPNLAGYEISFFFQPALQVSGDFYDTFVLPDNCVSLVIADVCDKGVGSALFMALFRSLIRVFSGRIHSGLFSKESKGTPATIDSNRALQAVTLTSDYIAEEHDRDGMFATLFFGVLNPETGDLAYINAGHETLYIIGPSGIKENLKPTGPAVGAMPGLRFRIQLAHMNPGDTLIGYTDGVTEALSPQNTFLTKERFISFIDRPALPASECIEEIKSYLFNHIDQAPQFDDITMIAVHRKP